MRNVATPWAAMPETAIDEYHYLGFRKMYVWVALNALRM
jgi:hypothetical protein